MNTPKELLSPEDFQLYETLKWPNNVFIINKALKEKLNTDPDYELWVPLVYRGGTGGPTVTEELHDEDILVSSKGNLYRKSTKTQTSGAVDKTTGYKYIMITSKDRGLRHNLRVGRIMACCFIEPLVNMSYATAVANHLNLDKGDNDFTNLEWVSQSANVKHAIDNGNRTYTTGDEHHTTIPLKGVVVDHGSYNGTTFLLSGYKEASDAGLTSAHLVAKGELNQTKGCKFSYPTEEELLTLTKWADVPVQLKQLMQSHNSSFKETIYGIHSTTLEVRPFIGTESMKNEGISHQSVYQSMSELGNKGLVKGWIFLRSLPGETLEQITERLKEKLLDYYVNSKYRTRCLVGTPVNGGDDVLFVGKRLLLEKEMNPKLAYRQADKLKHSYKGYILKEVPFKLEYIELL